MQAGSNYHNVYGASARWVQSLEPIVREAIKCDRHVYRNKDDDLMEFIRRRGGGKEVRWKRKKRRRGVMKTLDKINYYILIEIARS